MALVEITPNGSTVPLYGVVGDLTFRDAEQLSDEAAPNVYLDQERGWSGRGLEYLLAASRIRNLSVNAYSEVDVSPLNDLFWLDGLGLSGTLKGQLQFDRFEHLGRLSFHPKGRRLRVSGVSALPSLYAFVGHCGGEIAEQLSETSSLCYVRLFDARLLDLSVLSKNEGVKGLEVMAPKLLASIDDLAVMKKLELLKLTFAKKVRNYDALSVLRQLNFLYIDEGAALSSLKLIADVKDLAYVSLTGATSISDGDLSPLLGPSVRHAQVSDRDYYNVRNSDLKKDFGAAAARYRDFESVSAVFR